MPRSTALSDTEPIRLTAMGKIETALSMLASRKRELEELDRVTEWIRAVCNVYCEPGFAENAAVTNGFSDLLVELWGDADVTRAHLQGKAPPR